MLFLELSQKKLILVVIQEKKKERNQCMCLCMWLGGGEQLKHKLKPEQQNEFVSCYRMILKLISKPSFKYLFDKENTVHLLILLRSRNNVTRKDGMKIHQDACPLTFISSKMDWYLSKS